MRVWYNIVIGDVDETGNTAMVNLKDLTLDQIKDLLGRLGEPPYRALQLARWLFQRGCPSWDEMTDLPKDLRARLKEMAILRGLTLVQKQVSRRGDTIKYLFGLADGQAVESVFMRHTYGRSACISTQVGCRMGCRFCASTIGGLIRNLSPGEMYDQVLAMQSDVGERISHVVLMGSGEPLDNFEHVMIFLEHLTAPYGLHIGYRHITLSTCGVVPGILKLARRRLPLTLAVSLHAPNDELRNRLVPINRRHPLGELIPACREYIKLTGRRITFEYALLAGVNDSPRCALELARLVGGMLCHINLIPANPVGGKDFSRTPAVRVQRFKNLLEKAGLSVTVRRELGGDIDAACGQLRRRVLGLNG
ncbi:23S rRNA m(2)A-2503 methyltransferase [Desulfofundulus thermosubterraneus DSM 16057]|uniref:Probable dual-specificity RNA methyltransferase RlmN n=2 Tax=Desulfofundulus TaxID=2282741 RepID=A0A1M6BPD6_9FIRM|nr:23S rRNA m(2)A-2503 methyltransferase [Desulfofundulus thermosubterraneus DSM 16057]